MLLRSELCHNYKAKQNCANKFNRNQKMGKLGVVILGVLILFTQTSLTSKVDNCFNIVRSSETQLTFNEVICSNVTIMNGSAPTVETRNNYMIKFFSIAHGYIPILSANFFKHYPHLETIYFNSNKLKEIIPGAFEGLHSIRDLALLDNQIEEILEGTFRRLSNLTYLNLSKNKLQKLHRRSLYGLDNLVHLDLSYNLFTEITSNMFEATPLLRELILSNNSLHKINSISFFKLKNLMNLVLRQNYLEYISPDLFKGTNKMLYLDLSSNALKVLDINTLPNGLIIVNVSNNLIGTQPWFRFRGLEKLDISNTNTGDFVVGNAIKWLYVSRNNLKYLNETNFQNANNLIELDLSYNKIQEISKHVFRDAEKLGALNLSHNLLTAVPVGCFSNLSNLYKLDLSNNSFADIEFGTFSGLDNVSSLHLDHNKITSIPEKSLHVLRRLKRLYINNNLINQLNVHELLEHNPSIQWISLNRNVWECHNLFNILNELTNRFIGFSNGSDYNEENVNGIACSDENDFKIRKWTQPPPENLSASIVNPFSKYFDTDFKNSSFYQFFQLFFSDAPLKKSLLKLSTFFKYSENDFKKGNFFKHIDYNGKKNDDKQGKDCKETDDSNDSDAKESDPKGDVKENDSEEYTDIETDDSKEDANTDNGDSKEHPTTTPDYYSDLKEDAEPSALYAPDNHNIDFSNQILEFTNKVTLSVVLNVGILFTIIMFIIFVFFCRNRKRSMY